MKKNFLRVFSLLLVLSMLAISVNAVVTDKPQSEITIAAEPGTVVLCKGTTVTVTLTMPTCYGIEGKWTATDGLTLSSLTRDVDTPLSHTNGVVEWADVEGEDQNNWFKKPMGKMTATYTIPANTAAGEYTVAFTCTVFVGGKQIAAGDVEVWEGTFKYSVDIQVVEHDYSTEWTQGESTHWHACSCGAKSEEAAHADTATKDHKCDTCDYVMSECEDSDDTDHKCDHCGAEGVTEHSYEWKSNDEKHWRECACGAKSDEGDHDFTNGDCVCGAEKPVTDVVVTAKGTISHTVEGQVVTVTHSIACKVGYWDETEGKYIAIAATPNDDGSYSFTAPEGVTEVLLVAKGDVTGDGKCSVIDRGKVAKHTLKATHDNYATLTETWMIFAADINNNAKVDVIDRGNIAKHTLKETHENYTALTW